MEIFGNIIKILLVALVVFTPVYLIVKGHGIIKSLFISIPLCLLFFMFAVWWSDILPDIRLIIMGYNLDGMNESERLVNVSPELHKEATKIYESRFGIGWPLKAILGMEFYVIPYIAILFGGASIWRMVRKRTPNKRGQTRLKR